MGFTGAHVLYTIDAFILALYLLFHGCALLKYTCKHGLTCSALHYVHFVKYDDAVSFYDAVSDTIRRRGGNRGIFTEEGVDTVAYFGGNHGSRV